MNISMPRTLIGGQVRTETMHWFAGIVAVGFSVQTACGDGRDSDQRAQHGRALVEQRSQSLVASAILWLNGTYGSTCEGHAAGETWRLVVDQTAPEAADHAPLFVVAGNSTCTLVVTEAVASGGANGASITYESVAALSLAEDTWSPAVGFRVKDVDTDDLNDPVVFHASGRLSDFGGSAETFTLSLRYSEDLAQIQTGAVTAVPPPPS